MKTRRAFLALVASAALTLSLACCGVSSADSSHPITDFLDPDTVEFLNNWDLYTPSSCTYQTLGGARAMYSVGTTTTMKEVRDALMAMRLGDETAAAEGAVEEVFTFTLPSGTSYYVEFEGGNLVAANKRFTVTDDGGLWKLADEIAEEAGATSTGVVVGSLDSAPSTSAPGEGATAGSSPGTGTTGTAQGSAAGGASVTGSSEASSSASSGTSVGSPGTASETSATSAPTSAPQAEPEASAGAEPIQWTEPIGETAEGQNVEVTVTQ